MIRSIEVPGIIYANDKIYLTRLTIRYMRDDSGESISISDDSEILLQGLFNEKVREELGL